MAISIRPHHLLDILRNYGYVLRYQPHEYGHALHLVAEDILHNPDQEIALVIAAVGRCDDTMNRGDKVI